MKEIIMLFACFSFFVTANAQCSIEIEQDDDVLCVTSIQGSGDPFISWSTGEQGGCINPTVSGVYCAIAYFQDSCIVEQCYEFQGNPSDTLCWIEIFQDDDLLCVEAQGSGDPSIVWSSGEQGECINPTVSGVYCATAYFQDSCIVEQCYEFQGNPSDTLCWIEIFQDGDLLCVETQGSGDPFISWSTGEQGECINPTVSGVYCATAYFQDSCIVEQCYEFQGNPSDTLCWIEIFQDGDLLCVETQGSGDPFISWSTGEQGECINPTVSGVYCATAYFQDSCIVEQCYEFQGNPSDTLCWIEIFQDGDLLCVETQGSGDPFISWSTGEQGECINPTVSGIYCATAYFQDSCIAEQCYEFQGNPSDTLCWIEIFQDGDLLCVEAQGSGDPFISWSTGEQGECINPTVSGVYCATAYFQDSCIVEQCYEFQGNPSDTLCWIEIFQDGDLLCVEAQGSGDPSIVWSTGEQGECINPTVSGVYCATAYFQDSCIVEQCYEFQGNPSDTLCWIEIFQDGDLLCVEAQGSGDPSIVWSSGEQGECINPTVSGIYCATAYFQDSCITEQCYEFQGNPTDTTCFVTLELEENLLCALGTSGIAPFNYLWNTGAVSECITVTSSGEYCVTLTDSLGCQSISCFDVVLTATHQEVLSNSVKISPNPFNDYLIIEAEILRNSDVVIEIVDINGRVRFEETETFNDNTIQLSVTDLPSGAYFIRLRNKEMQITKRVIRF